MYLHKNFFCPPAGKRQLSGRCAKRSCRFPPPSSKKIVYRPWPVKKKPQITRLSSPASPRPTITCDLRHFLFYWPCVVYYFLQTYCAIIHRHKPQKHAQRVKKNHKVPWDLIKIMLKCMEIAEKGLRGSYT